MSLRGVVAEVGKDVEGISVGDRVMAVTFGGMAEYVPITPALLGFNVYKVPEEVGWGRGCNHRAPGELPARNPAGHPCRRPECDDLRGRYHRPGSGTKLQGDGSRLEQAHHGGRLGQAAGHGKRAGGGRRHHAAKEDVYARAMELTGEVPIEIIQGAATSPAVDIVYDCVGYIQERPETPVIQQALLIAREYGKVVVHGVFEAPVTLESDAHGTQTRPGAGFLRVRSG